MNRWGMSKDRLGVEVSFLTDAGAKPPARITAFIVCLQWGDKGSGVKRSALACQPLEGGIANKQLGICAEPGNVPLL